jgi:hypothetical protein
VLSPRLFASKVRVDVGRIVSTQDKNFDRYHQLFAIGGAARPHSGFGLPATKSA